VDVGISDLDCYAINGHRRIAHNGSWQGVQWMRFENGPVVKFGINKAGDILGVELSPD